MLINPKKYSCNGLKQNSQKENVNENKFMRLEPSPPPPNFSNGAIILVIPANKNIWQYQLFRENLNRAKNYF